MNEKSVRVRQKEIFASQVRLKGGGGRGGGKGRTGENERSQCKDILNEPARTLASF